eukprot:5929094-Pyramimonas_sp.AAC.1
MPYPTQPASRETYHTYRGACAYAVPVQAHALAQLGGSVFAELHAAGVPARVYTDDRGLPVSPPPPADMPAMECPWCGQGFARHRALRTHVARMHRQLSTLARGYAGHD